MVNDLELDCAAAHPSGAVAVIPEELAPLCHSLAHARERSAVVGEYAEADRLRGDSRTGVGGGERATRDQEQHDAESALHGAVTTSSSPSAYCRRSSFLSNLPTDVFGTSMTNAHRSGSCQRASVAARNSRSSPGVTKFPFHTTTVASGRSPQRSSGTPTTAASTTSGCAISRVSSSTEEIHSPPDLITSFARSVIVRKPSGVIVPTSPVDSQPP